MYTHTLTCSLILLKPKVHTISFGTSILILDRSTITRNGPQVSRDTNLGIIFKRVLRVVLSLYIGIGNKHWFRILIVSDGTPSIHTYYLLIKSGGSTKIEPHIIQKVPNIVPFHNEYPLPIRVWGIWQKDWLIGVTWRTPARRAYLPTKNKPT